MYRIEVGKYRTGDIQVVSDAMGKEKIHYEVPKSERVSDEMNRFLNWINTDIDPVLKAAIAHFWFITIHPFDDGNGRIARVITDMLLARADNSSQQFYSISNQILAERKQYYAILEEAQRGTGDITKWLMWFLNCLEQALRSTDTILASILIKAKFWDTHTSNST